MKIAIVCGSPWSRPHDLFDILEAAGVTPAKTTDRSLIGDIQSWHEKLIDGRGEHPSLSPIEPGRAWEQAAGEIFLANWDQAQWGWANSRSTWLLEFWRDFDPQTRFILVSSSPEHELERAIVNTIDVDFDPNQVIADWVAHNQAMLQFFQRNRERCLFVNAEDAASEPQAFSRACAEMLDIGQEVAFEQPRNHLAKTSSLAEMLARQAVTQFPEISELRHEIDACLTACGPARQDARQSRSTHAAHSRIHIEEFRELLWQAGPLMQQLGEENSQLRYQIDQQQIVRDALDADLQVANTLISRLESRLVVTTDRLEQENQRITEAARLELATITQTLQAEIEQLQVERNGLEAQVRTAEAAADTLHARLAETTARHEEEVRQLQATAAADLNAARQELQQENELLLLQLHQVQEELEQTFLGSQEQAKRIAELEASAKSIPADYQARIDAIEKDKANLAAARDFQSKLATERQAQVERLMQAHDAQAKLATEREAQVAQMAKAQDDNAKAANDLKARLTALEKEKAELTAARDAQAKLTKEREAQVAQMTKAQDDNAKATNDLKARLTALEKEKAELAAARDSQTKLAAERQAQVTQLIQARDEQSKLAAERQKQIEQLTKARDEYARTADDLKNQLETKKNNKAKLANELAEREKQLAEQTQKVAVAQKQLQDAKQQQQAAETELHQENELLLLQLHQVQEELEHYFLKHQEAQHSLQDKDTRWQKFLDRHPDYCEWDNIELLDVQQDGAEPLARWRVTGLLAGGKTHPSIEVTTRVHQGQPALTLHRSASEPGRPAPMRWQDDAPELDQLTLQPEGDAAGRKEREAALAALSTADWRLAKSLCAVLIDYLQSPGIAKDNRLDTALWASQAAALRTQLDQAPPVWRYDQCTLKRQQVNPDYEHLWFKLSNAEFGQRVWPEFEFRLGAALVRPGSFSIHPKFEFPQPDHGAKQFENWFEESFDDFGGKFELRFELKNMGMDLGAWNALSETDKAQLWAIALDIPKLLARLEAANLTVSRPWADWQKLAAGILEAMRLRAMPLPVALVEAKDAAATAEEPAQVSAAPAQPPAPPILEPAPAAKRAVHKAPAPKRPAAKPHQPQGSRKTTASKAAK